MHRLTACRRLASTTSFLTPYAQTSSRKISARSTSLFIDRFSSPQNRTFPILTRCAKLSANTHIHNLRFASNHSERDVSEKSASPTHAELGKTPSKNSSSSKLASTPAALLDAARTRTTELGAKVRSSLENITPHENIYNLPNFLTVTRLIAAPATAYLLLHDQHTWALALFAYAGITDLVDGWMARRWKLQTVAGSVIDPMADKALMIIVTVTLAIKGAIPAYLATLILGRDAALGIAAFYYRYASLPPPKTMMRYWDFSLPSAEVHPTTVSKYNTFLQLVLIGSTLALPVITASAHGAGALNAIHLDAAHLNLGLTYFQYLVAATTAWSGLSYAYLKNAVTILGSNEELKAKQGARGRAIIGVTFGSLVLLAAWQHIRGDGDATEEVASPADARATS